MNNNQVISISKELKSGGEGYKVIQVNVSNPTDNLYAVCTPVQNNNK